jgi:hypothetical protein
MAQKITTCVTRNIHFFQVGCGRFYRWMDEYAKAIVGQTLHTPPPLQSGVYRQEQDTYEQLTKRYDQAMEDFKEGKRADRPMRTIWVPWQVEKYTGSLHGDDYCLTFPREPGWKPIELVHPLGCFRLPTSCAPLPLRHLTDVERQMCDCVVLGFIYGREVRHPGERLTVFPLASCSSFNLKEFWGDLQKKLNTPDGELVIKEAWTRTRTALEKEKAGESIWQESKQAEPELPNGDIPRLKVSALWNCLRLQELRKIDAESKRRGIQGDRTKLKRLKEYLTKRRKRQDIADTLYLEGDKIKTRMACCTMFMDD